MHNLTVTDKNFSNNVFKRIYNFSAPDRSFEYQSYSDTNHNQSDKKPQQRYKKIGLLLVGLGLLLFSRGVLKRTKQFLEGVNDYLSLKKDKHVFDDSISKASFYNYTMRSVNSVIRKTEIINNAVSIKDMLFMRFMYKTKPTKLIHQKISNYFENLSRNTVIKSYKYTQKFFDKMFTNFDKLDEYILRHSANEVVEFRNQKYTKKELIEKARYNRSIVKMIVDAFIDKSAQNGRYDYIKKSTSTLCSEIWDFSFKDFWTKNNKFRSKEMWQSFIASERIKTNKTDLTSKVSYARNILSYTDAEKKAYISTCIENLSSIIPVDDTGAFDILDRLKWYIKDTSLLSENTENFLKELEKLEKYNINIENSIFSKQKLSEDKNINISLIRELISEDSPGDIENILEIYRKIAPIELSKSGTLKSVNKAIKSFDRSINLEVNQLFDKLRDLEIGSAPTDVLTILFSSALIASAIQKAKDKDERASIILKSGIPIAGAIMVTLISAAKLISGGKSMAFGVVSGFIMNRLGEDVDNYRKRVINKK